MQRVFASAKVRRLYSRAKDKLSKSLYKVDVMQTLNWCLSNLKRLKEAFEANANPN